MKGKNGIVDFSRARVSRKKVSPGRYGGNIAIFFFGLIRWLYGVSYMGESKPIKRGGEGTHKIGPLFATL